jgi:hypothetical protein
MRWLIRRVTRKGKGSVAYEEDIHYGDVLTLGRGSDQAIFVPDLRVALEHARITAVGAGRYKIESLIIAGIRVDDAITHATTVGAGAVVDIGTTRIQLLDPPTDFDAGVEVSTIDKAEIKATAQAKAKPTQLAQTWLARRFPSWALFGAIALLFLILPMTTHFVPPMRAILPGMPLVPSQDAWQSGDLQDAHHFFGSDCTQCHEKPFRWVRDESCAKCHAGTPAHADPVKFNLPELGEARCAHCHRDHNGSDGLIVRDQELCSDCHEGLKERTGGASLLANVADFGLDHPQFKVDLPAWSAEGKYTPVRTLLGTPGLQERSGLKFPHDKHMNPKGIKSPTGEKVLDCDSCHRPEPGGAGMQPVDFETMCQACHALTFDVTEPGRQVPHAKVPEIIYMLDEFYARRALEGGVSDVTSPAIVQQRRRPGQALTRQEQFEALAWAREKARRTAETLFTGSACTVCHAVSPGREAGDPWRVAPVRVAGVWYAKADFTHGSHTTMACADCHDAATSKASTDLLIPGIDNCQQCHAGEKARDKVPTTCIGCHGYHDSEHLILAELQQRAKAAQAPPAPAAAGGGER